MPINEHDFRRVLGSFATGVTVVTTMDGISPHGMTASAFTSVSLRPPLVLVCLDKTSVTHGLVLRTQSFAVNILTTEEAALAQRFARKEPEAKDRFRQVSYRSSFLGNPLLEGCLGYLDCRLKAAYEGGDHTIFLGEVEALDLGQGQPLVVYQRDYHFLKRV